MKEQKKHSDYDPFAIAAQSYRREKTRNDIPNKMHGKSLNLFRFIALFNLLFMTIGLFLFYSSAFYNLTTPMGHKKNDSIIIIFWQIFNPMAITNAFRTSVTDGLFIIVYTFPFFAMGFTMFYYRIKKKYFISLIMLLLTLAFDLLIAYKIVMETYIMKRATSVYGGIPEWEPKMIFLQSNFYIILLCGFVTYVMWGQMLYLYYLTTLKKSL